MASTGDTSIDTLAEQLPEEKKCILRGIPKNSKRIVDVGCGLGSLTACISHRFPGSHVVGVDGDEAHVAEARSAYCRENLQFVHAHIQELGADTYDVAVFCSVIEHLPNVGQSLDVLNGLVTPGGYLFVDTDNAHSLKFLLANLWYGYTKRAPSMYLWHDLHRFLWWNHHLYSWTLSTLATLLMSYGFELEEYWFTNHSRSIGLVDKCFDWVTTLIPALRRHMVLKLKKVGPPTIHERSPNHPVD